MNHFKGWQKLFQHTLFCSSKCKPKNIFTSALPDFKYQFQLSGLKNASEITGQVELLLKKARRVSSSIKSNNISNQMMHKGSWKSFKKCHEVKVDAIKTYRFPVTISTKITIHDNPYESQRSWAPCVCVCVCVCCRSITLRILSFALTGLYKCR